MRAAVAQRLRLTVDGRPRLLGSVTAVDSAREERAMAQTAALSGLRRTNLREQALLALLRVAPAWAERLAA